MTLQEFYDMAIEKGATPDSLVIVEYCDINHFEVRDIENNPNKGIFIPCIEEVDTRDEILKTLKKDKTNG